MKLQGAKTVLYALSAFREAEIKEATEKLDEEKQRLGRVFEGADNGGIYIYIIYIYNYISLYIYNYIYMCVIICFTYI